MKFNSGFILMWILTGCAILILPFRDFIDELFLFSFLILFFSTATIFQFQFQKKWINEAHNTHTWERTPLKQYGSSLLYSMLFGIGQAAVISIVCFFFFDAEIEYRNFYSLLFGASLFQVFVLTFVIQIRYLLRQRAFLKKESEGFEYLSRVTQIKALQELVSPHFLFNSLNTAASIIPDEPKVGLKFVTELSALYEFILKNNENQLITLQEEIEIVEKYGFLMQTRFGTFFQIQLDISSEYHSTMIPPLGLQNLVENATKHNAVTRKKPLLLEVFIEGNYIIIRNNINPKKTISNESTNLGLDYINSKINEFSDRKMEVDFGEEFFTVKIPLIYPSSIN